MDAVRSVLRARGRSSAAKLATLTKLSRNQVHSALDGLVARGEIAVDEKTREVWIETTRGPISVGGRGDKCDTNE